MPNADEYDGLFDDLEYLIGLANFDFVKGSAPIGRFGWRRRYAERGQRDQVIRQHADEILASGMFNRSWERLMEVKAQYDQFVDANAHYR